MENPLGIAEYAINKSGLVEVKGGFYTFTDNQPQSVDELAILVHACDELYKDDDANPDYEEKRDEFIRTYDKPIIFGFDGCILPDALESIEWLRSFSSVEQKYIYFTEGACPTPLIPSKGKFNISIKEAFNPSKIILGGAELWDDENGKNTGYGCVNKTHDYLRSDFDVIIEKEICWRYANQYSLDLNPLHEWLNSLKAH